MIKRLMSLLLLAFVVTACATETREDPQIVVAPQKTDALLADAADRATKALESLAQIEKAKNPGKGDSSIPNAPTELRRSITLAWNGPAEPAVKLLADRASYAFETVGNAPPSGVMVNIDVRATPIITVLRSVGAQLGNRATLKVDPNARVIELQYAPVTAGANEGQ
jgi:defect-in-organelle-trafficking protein DotD